MGFRSAIRVRRQKLKKLGSIPKRINSRRTVRVEGQQRPPAKPSFFRFAASSLTCTAVDQVLAAALFYALRKPMADMGFVRILVSSVIARCVSLSLNYVLNRRLVFFPEDEEGTKRPRKRESLPQFLLLAAGILGLSSLGVFLANTYLGVEEWQAKFVVDFLLFFLNYYVQRKWVFKTEITVPMDRDGASCDKGPRDSGSHEE